MVGIDLSGLAVQRRAPSNRASLKRVVARYAVPALLIAGLLVLIGWSSRRLLFPARPVTVVPVIVAASQSAPAGTPVFKAAGWVEPRPTPIRVAALAPGVVESLLVVEDQWVSRGEPIAELVKQDARLNLQRAQADLALRRAELDEAEAALEAAGKRLEQPLHLQADVGEAEASLAKIETQLKNLPYEKRRAEAELEARTREYESKLAAEGAVPGVAIATARSRTDAAQADVDELKQRESSLQRERAAAARRLDALREQLSLLVNEKREARQAEARVAAAEARLQQSLVAEKQAQLQLDRMTITAPVDGRIFRLISQPGSQVGGAREAASADDHDGGTVVTMYQPELLQVRVDVRFENLPSVQLNQPVEIDNPAIATSIGGRVLFISSEADIQKNTLQVKVAVPDPPSVFKPDMLVEVTFLSDEPGGQGKTTSEEPRIYVPGRLVRDSAEGPYVWIADRSAAAARKQKVRVGPATASVATGAGDLVPVLEGLNASSRLIASNFEGLHDGDRIKISSQRTRAEPLAAADASSDQLGKMGE